MTFNARGQRRGHFSDHGSPYRIDIIRTARWLIPGIIGRNRREIKIQSPFMSERVLCDLCGQSIPPHAHYIVRIDVFADPTLPAMSTEELERMEMDETLTKLLEQMKMMSADELQDQVHRRFEYKLCRACQRSFLVNPLGKPRERKIGEN